MAQRPQVRAGDKESLPKRIRQGIQKRARGWEGHEQARAACGAEAGKQRTNPVSFR
jgi:hypothetical protein